MLTAEEVLSLSEVQSHPGFQLILSNLQAELDDIEIRLENKSDSDLQADWRVMRKVIKKLKYLPQEAANLMEPSVDEFEELKPRNAPETVEDWEKIKKELERAFPKQPVQPIQYPPYPNPTIPFPNPGYPYTPHWTRINTDFPEQGTIRVLSPNVNLNKL